MKLKKHLMAVTLAGMLFFLLSEGLITYVFRGYGYAQAVDHFVFAHLEGRVFSSASGLPIPRARISISPLNYLTFTDDQGRFTWYSIPLDSDSLPISVIVQADGFGDWSISQVLLIAGDTLILTIHLTEQSYAGAAPSPGLRNAVLPDGDLLFDSSSIASLEHHAGLPIPQNIRIRVSGYPYHCDPNREYTISVVDFKQYVKHVLPNEWNASWHPESLRAGAMAVKMYAWHWVARGGKWKDADVWDSTCDQVYHPAISYRSTNEAVDFIWDWVLSNQDLLTHTSYRAYLHQCESAGLIGSCMGQWESKAMADDGSTWGQVLSFFYHDTFVSPANPGSQLGYHFRFNGSPDDVNANRVMIPLMDMGLEDPNTLPVNVGAEDFTIEFRMRAYPYENEAALLVCRDVNNWVYGNILLDRSQELPGPSYGLSLASGKLVFGVSGEDGGSRSICSDTFVANGEWHHVALQRRRSDGAMWLFVDGRLEQIAIGPPGDLSYSFELEPTHPSDPYLAIGSWKRDVDQVLHPYFRGWMDDVMISNILRYTQDFPPPEKPFTPDLHTTALFNFDDGLGNLVIDSAIILGPRSHGARIYGGKVKGPLWMPDNLFPRVFLPLTNK
jgi:hypothetical protein